MKLLCVLGLAGFFSGLVSCGDTPGTEMQAPGDGMAGFRYETFSGLDDSDFRIYAESGESLDVSLVRVDDLSRGMEAGSGGRKPFSLVFSGPTDREFSQGTYRMEHGKIGLFEVFLVPVVPPQGSDERWYEAVFN